MKIDIEDVLITRNNRLVVSEQILKIELDDYEFTVTARNNVNELKFFSGLRQNNAYADDRILTKEQRNIWKLIREVDIGKPWYDKNDVLNIEYYFRNVEKIVGHKIIGDEKLKAFINICVEKYKSMEVRNELRSLIHKFSEDYVMQELRLMMVEDVHKA